MVELLVDAEPSSQAIEIGAYLFLTANNVQAFNFGGEVKEEIELVSKVLEALPIQVGREISLAVFLPDDE